MNRDDPLEIVLLMFSTRSDNFGVGALTISHVDILRQISAETGRRIHITIVDSMSRRTPYLMGPDIDVVDLNRAFFVSPSGLWRLLRRSDLVIDIGAGDSFADIYGSGRLRRIFYLKFCTHFAGRPLVVAPQTIGPFFSGVSRTLALWTISRSRIVATRDSMSSDEVRKLGFSGPVVVASDVALRLPYKPISFGPSPQPRVGVNVSGLLFNRGYTGKNEFGISFNYQSVIREILSFFLASGAEVHLVPHVLTQCSDETHREDDAAACRLSGKDFGDRVVLPRFANPSEAKGYISGLDFFVGARMHSCIAALSAGVPVVPMAYSRKFAGLFGSIGYNRTLDCSSMDDVASLSFVKRCYAEREVLRLEAIAATQVGLQRLSLYENALKEVVLSL